MDMDAPDFGILAPNGDRFPSGVDDLPFNTGVRRKPPVSGIRSGFGSTIGTMTERQASPFKPKQRRIFSA